MRFYIGMSNDIDQMICYVTHMELTLNDKWSNEGYLKLHGFLSAQRLQAIKAEADLLQHGSVSRGVQSIEVRRDGSFASPSRFSAHTGGPELRKLHRDIDLLTKVREATGMDRLIPVRATYNYYAPGDFMGVHRDEIRATATLTFPLTENMPSTFYKGEGRNWDDDSLLDYVDKNGVLPESGDEMSLEAGTLNMFDGYNLPHWRPPVSEPHILGNLIYFRL